MQVATDLVFRRCGLLLFHENLNQLLLMIEDLKLTGRWLGNGFGGLFMYYVLVTGLPPEILSSADREALDFDRRRRGR
jgi:hypothetical protein